MQALAQVTRVDIAGSLVELEQLREEWRGLYARAPRATPFLSPEWLIPWTRYFFKGGKIWTLAIRDGNDLIGLVPLFCWGVRVKTVSFLGAGVSDYGDILIETGRERECVAAMRGFLAQRRDEWDRLDLREVRAGSVLLEEWASEPCSVCPVVDLRAYPEALEKKHRSNVKHAHNRLAKHESAKFGHSDDLAEFFRLHEARWGTLEDAVKRFHADIVREFRAAGTLRLCRMEVDGAPAASIYGFRGGSTIYVYLTGYDRAMAAVSPGMLIIEWLLERAIEEGCTEVDFLRQKEAYKYLWGAKDRVSYVIHG